MHSEALDNVGYEDCKQGFRDKELLYQACSFQSLYPIHISEFQYFGKMRFFASALQLVVGEKCQFILPNWQWRPSFSLCMKA